MGATDACGCQAIETSDAWGWLREMGNWALADKRPVFRSLLCMTLTIIPGLPKLTCGTGIASTPTLTGGDS